MENFAPEYIFQLYKDYTDIRREVKNLEKINKGDFFSSILKLGSKLSSNNLVSNLRSNNSVSKLSSNNSVSNLPESNEKSGGFRFI